MSSELRYVCDFKRDEIDLLLSLVNEKNNQLEKLSLKRHKQLVAIVGEEALNDYINCLSNLLKKLDSLIYE